MSTLAMLSLTRQTQRNTRNSIVIFTTTVWVELFTTTNRFTSYSGQHVPGSARDCRCTAYVSAARLVQLCHSGDLTAQDSATSHGKGQRGINSIQPPCNHEITSDTRRSELRERYRSPATRGRPADHTTYLELDD